MTVNVVSVSLLSVASFTQMKQRNNSSCSQQLHSGIRVKGGVGWRAHINTGRGVWSLIGNRWRREPLSYVTGQVGNFLHWQRHRSEQLKTEICWESVKNVADVNVLFSLYRCFDHFDLTVRGIVFVALFCKCVVCVFHWATWWLCLLLKPFRGRSVTMTNWIWFQQGFSSILFRDEFISFWKRCASGTLDLFWYCMASCRAAW